MQGVYRNDERRVFIMLLIFVSSSVASLRPARPGHQMHDEHTSHAKQTTSHIQSLQRRGIQSLLANSVHLEAACRYAPARSRARKIASDYFLNLRGGESMSGNDDDEVAADLTPDEVLELPELEVGGTTFLYDESGEYFGVEHVLFTLDGIPWGIYDPVTRTAQKVEFVEDDDHMELPAPPALDLNANRHEGSHDEGSHDELKSSAFEEDVETRRTASIELEDEDIAV